MGNPSTYASTQYDNKVAQFPFTNSDESGNCDSPTAQDIPIGLDKQITTPMLNEDPLAADMEAEKGNELQD